MPATIQIVPKYTYPHEETYINDNTSDGYEESQSIGVTYPYISVFASPKGLDGKLVKLSNRQKYYDVFGKTNYKKYGQPHLMPEAILSQEDAEVWCMRVMPDDAQYANSILSAWYKEDVENKAFRIKFTTKSITSESEVKGDYENIGQILHDRDAIVEYGNTLDGVALEGKYVDDEGYTQVPIAVFTAPGRGNYGKNLRWRIIPNEDYENEYGIKLYSFEIIDTESSNTLVSTHVGSIVSSTSLDQTVFINDLVEDSSVVSLGAYINVNEDNVEALYNAYKAFCEKVVEENPSEVISIPDIEHFDLFFGKEVKKQKVRVTPAEPYLMYVSELTDDVDTHADDYKAENFTETEIIDPSDVTGNAFDGGSDGKFDLKDAAERQKAIDDCYIKAFHGEYDKLILAPKRIKSCALFDADYNMPVKMALATLAMYRADAILYLDTNHNELFGMTDISAIDTAFSAISDLTEDFPNFGEPWCISVNTHDYYIKESSTGKRIPVTITYYLASTDVNYIKNGISTSRTGNESILSGHIKNSLMPCIAENEQDLKQELYNSRINYFEDEGDNIFTRATQSMYVDSDSDLLEESNARALFELKRALESDCKENRNQITTAAKRAEFKTYLLEKYKYMVGDYFDTLDILYTSNEYESRRNIVHVYASVTFPRRSKITLIEIDVNKSTYVSDESEG